MPVRTRWPEVPKVHLLPHRSILPRVLRFARRVSQEASVLPSPSLCATVVADGEGKQKAVGRGGGRVVGHPAARDRERALVLLDALSGFGIFWKWFRYLDFRITLIAR